MTETLADQLDKLGDQLPTVHSSHYALLQKNGNAGPVAFLFERRDPTDAPPSLRMESVVMPTFQALLHVSKKKRFVPTTRRVRYRFNYRHPRGSVILPVGAECPRNAKLVKIADELYERLRDHDNTAWEELLGAFLDVPCNAPSR